LQDDPKCGLKPTSGSPSGNDNSSETKTKLNDWFKCLWERSNLSVTAECSKSLLDIVNNPFYLICAQNGVSGNPKINALLETLDADGYNQEGEKLTPAEVAAIAAKKQCKVYTTYNGKMVCEAYQTLYNVRIQPQQKERYVWAFIRFWLRQSTFTDKKYQQKIDSDECNKSNETWEKYLAKIKIDERYQQAWCEKQTVGAMHMLRDAYTDNFFHNSCPAGFDLDNQVNKGDNEDEACGRIENLDVYCSEAYPHCKPSSNNSEAFVCVSSDDDTLVATNSTAKNWSNYYLPPACAAKPTDESAQSERQLFIEKKKKCLYLLTDIKSWYHHEGVEDSEGPQQTCTYKNKPVKPSSGLGNDHPDECAKIDKTRYMCDKWDKQYCVKKNGTSTSQCQSELPSGDDEHIEAYSFNRYAWQCRPLSYRFDGSIIVDQDEYEYGDESYFTNTEKEVHQERTLKDITKHVMDYCGFDVGLDNKAKYIAALG